MKECPRCGYRGLYLAGHACRVRGPVAQRTERRVPDPEVTGSSPAGPTKAKEKKATGNAARVKRWKEKHPEAWKKYHREYMRKWKARAK